MRLHAIPVLLALTLGLAASPAAVDAATARKGAPLSKKGASAKELAAARRVPRPPQRPNRRFVRTYRARKVDGNAYTLEAIVGRNAGVISLLVPKDAADPVLLQRSNGVGIQAYSKIDLERAYKVKAIDEAAYTRVVVRPGNPAVDVPVISVMLPNNPADPLLVERSGVRGAPTAYSRLNL